MPTRYRSARDAAFPLVVALALAAPTPAAERLVPDHYPTIAAALAAAAPGDEVVLACGTYHERGLALRSGVTLRSVARDPACVTIDGDGLGGVLLASYATDAALEGLTVRGGHAANGAGLRSYSSNPLIRNCRFFANTSTGMGAAIHTENGPLRMEDTIVADNHVVFRNWGASGAVSVANNAATFVRCTITGNTYIIGSYGVHGGGVRLGPNVTAHFDHTIVALNTEPQIGGQVGWAATYDCHSAADPHFCNPASLDFRLDSTSSCLPEGQCEDLIGALGYGCGPVGPDVECTVTASPPGQVIRIDGVEHMTPVTFLWPRYSEHVVESVDEPGSGSRWGFASWSDGRTRVHRIIAPPSGRTWTATYRREHYLTVQPPPDGTATPESGWFAEGESVTLHAVTPRRIAVLGWEGSGPGSYTGAENPIAVVIEGPITQIARSTPISYQFSVSGSDTDPFLNVSPPTGLGNRVLYLWLTCSASGLAALEVETTGTLTPLLFEPLNGVLSVGTARNLLLAIPGCPTGESISMVLGQWFVSEPAGGGSFCLGGSAREEYEVVPTGAVDCQTVEPYLVRFPGVAGFASSGAAPCLTGQRICGESGGAGMPSPITATTALGLPSTPGAWSLQSDPNPFSSAVTVRFALPFAGPTSLRIYDVAGRLVRTLVREPLATGAHERSWDGRGESGERTPSGVYFLRLEAGGEALHRKVLQLRD